MPRFGCFAIRTICRNCGQSVPLNGPFRRLTCSGCYEKISIPAETIAGFINDFEEEYPKFDEGAGSSGTQMGGGGTFEYNYWKMEPRCIKCKKKLPDPDMNIDNNCTCPECENKYETFPVPEWLKELVPSAEQYFGPEREIKEGDSSSLEMDQSISPVVMSCPQCGGSLSVTAGSERILKCEYCKTDIYVPDPVWLRLHPVKTTSEWFLRLDGRTVPQLSAERRIRDERDEKEFLKQWRPGKKRQVQGKRIKPLLIGIPSAILIFILVFMVMYLMGYSAESIGKALSVILTVIVIGGIIVVSLLSALYMEIAYKFGFPGKCKRALSEMALKYGWKHESAEFKNCMGSIDGKYQGREFEIQPDDDYAIEVDIDSSPFYLKSEPPGYPPDGLFRFSTGDPLFDNSFPIRYAEPGIVKQMTEDPAFLKEVLSPFYWFLHRWGEKLGAMLIDWSTAAVHLSPGHKENSVSSIRYIYPDELEPLFKDMIILARAIEAAVHGEKPDLPGRD